MTEEEVFEVVLRWAEAEEIAMEMDDCIGFVFNREYGTDTDLDLDIEAFSALSFEKRMELAMLTKETQFKEELNDKLGELRRISFGVTFGVATSLPKRSVVEILRDLLNEQKKKTREGQKETLEQKKNDSELTPNETKELEMLQKQATLFLWVNGEGEPQGKLKDLGRLQDRQELLQKNMERTGPEQTELDNLRLKIDTDMGFMLNELQKSELLIPYVSSFSTDILLRILRQLYELRLISVETFPLLVLTIIAPIAPTFQTFPQGEI